MDSRKIVGWKRTGKFRSTAVGEAVWQNDGSVFVSAYPSGVISELAEPVYETGSGEGGELQRFADMLKELTSRVLALESRPASEKASPTSYPKCPHTHIKRTPDPSGNNDTDYSCEDCGKPMTREEYLLAKPPTPPPNPPESVVAEFVRDLKRNESLGTARMSISAERAKELHTALASCPPVTEEIVERVAEAMWNFDPAHLRWKHMSESMRQAAMGGKA